MFLMTNNINIPIVPEVDITSMNRQFKNNNTHHIDPLYVTIFKKYKKKSFNDINAKRSLLQSGCNVVWNISKELQFKSSTSS